MKSLRPFVFLLFATLACAQIQDPHLQKGVELLREQQYAAALRELEQARRAHPSTSELENLIGIATTQLGQLAAADAHYRRAIALNPDLPGPHKNLGFNLFNEKLYRQGEQELKRALALDPSDSFTHYYLASLYLASSNDAEAVRQLPMAEMLLANDPENQFLMVKACLNTGDIAGAKRLIESLTTGGQLAPPWEFELAVLLSAKHLYAEAEQRFEHLAAAEPQSWVAQYDLAIAQLNAGHAEKALLLLKPLAQRQPGNPALLTFLGSAYEAANQLPQALNAYQKAVQADPQNPDRYLDYTRLLMDLDRTDEATKVIEDGITGASSNEDPYALELRLGVLRLKQARFDDARVAFHQAILLHPELIVGYVALAQSFMQQGSDDKALELLLKVRSTLPQDAKLEYYIGLISLRIGRTGEAETALKNSVSLRPDVVESHYQLGKLYMQTNRLSPAQSEFERVIILSPENSNAHYQLSKIYARLGDTKKATQMADETKRLMQTQREAAISRQTSHLTAFQTPE